MDMKHEPIAFETQARRQWNGIIQLPPEEAEGYPFLRERHGQSFLEFRMLTLADFMPR